MTVLRHRPACRRPDAERGSAPVELVLITPAILLLLLLVVAGGRIVQAENQVESAARDAARAGTIARSPGAARRAATDVATSLPPGGESCRSFDVAVDTSRFGPGGTVSTTVTCVVGLADLASLRIPGSKTVAARATETVDAYRGAAP